MASAIATLSVSVVNLNCEGTNCLAILAVASDVIGPPVVMILVAIAALAYEGIISFRQKINHIFIIVS